jgi:Fur family transcriptional regulator, ferric uptake regulator
VTPQKLAVPEALAAGWHHSLAEVRGRCRGVGLVTIYRTLDLFSGLGLVRRLDLGGGPRYGLTEVDHRHLICESYGDVSEFEECPVDLLRLRDMDFEVGSHSLQIYGRCSGCR